MNKPQEISTEEWRELTQLRAVGESWGLSDDTPEEFSNMAYGVKFDFMSGGPGYVGELFILHGDALGTEPMVIIRREGHLVVA